MKLIQCRFSSGQRLPLLVQAGDATPLPILIPFIYVQLKLRHRAYNTAAAHLRAIQAFYAYAKSRDLDEVCNACFQTGVQSRLWTRTNDTVRYQMTRGSYGTTTDIEGRHS